MREASPLIGFVWFPGVEGLAMEDVFMYGKGRKLERFWTAFAAPAT